MFYKFIDCQDFSYCLKSIPESKKIISLKKHGYALITLR